MPRSVALLRRHADKAALLLLQETPDPPEALNCIPSLQLADIPKTVTAVPTDISHDQVRWFCVQCQPDS